MRRTQQLLGLALERFPLRACFHAQRAAELFLKAASIAVTGDHPRAHTGGILIEEIRDAGCDVRTDIAAPANSSVLAVGQARSVFDYAADLVRKLKEATARPE